MPSYFVRQSRAVTSFHISFLPSGKEYDVYVIPIGGSQPEPEPQPQL